MGLLGALFAAVTFPGSIVNGAVQGAFEARYGAPTRRIAMPEDIDPSDLEENPELIEQVRELGPGGRPREGESVTEIVDYGAIPEYTQLFGLVLGPFFVTSAIAVALYGVLAGLEFVGLLGRDANGWLWLAAFYPGFTVASRAFPNSEPTNELYQRSRETDSLLRLVGYPVVLVSKAINLLRYLWADAIYAIVLYFAVITVVGTV